LKTVEIAKIAIIAKNRRIENLVLVFSAIRVNRGNVFDFQFSIFGNFWHFWQSLLISVISVNQR